MRRPDVDSSVSHECIHPRLSRRIRTAHVGLYATTYSLTVLHRPPSTTHCRPTKPPAAAFGSRPARANRSRLIPSGQPAAPVLLAVNRLPSFFTSYHLCTQRRPAPTPALHLHRLAAALHASGQSCAPTTIAPPPDARCRAFPPGPDFPLSRVPNAFCEPTWVAASPVQPTTTFLQALTRKLRQAWETP